MSNLFPFNNEKFDNLYDRVDNLVRGSVNQARNFFMDNFRLDIREDDQQYILEAELPGVQKDEISVTIDQGNVTISVEKDEQQEEEKEGYVHKERRYRTMRRQVHLNDVDDEATSARMEDGILYVTVKKIPTEDTSRQVDID